MCRDEMLVVLLPCAGHRLHEKADRLLQEFGPDSAIGGGIVCEMHELLVW
jgi:hypothetical protein